MKTNRTLSDSLLYQGYIFDAKDGVRYEIPSAKSTEEFAANIASATNSLQKQGGQPGTIELYYGTIDSSLLLGQFNSTEKAINAVRNHAQSSANTTSADTKTASETKAKPSSNSQAKEADKDSPVAKAEQRALEELTNIVFVLAEGDTLLLNHAFETRALAENRRIQLYESGKFSDLKTIVLKREDYEYRKSYGCRLKNTAPLGFIGGGALSLASGLVTALASKEHKARNTMITMGATVILSVLGWAAFVPKDLNTCNSTAYATE